MALKASRRQKAALISGRAPDRSAASAVRCCAIALVKPRSEIASTDTPAKAIGDPKRKGNRLTRAMLSEAKRLRPKEQAAPQQDLRTRGLRQKPNLDGFCG